VGRYIQQAVVTGEGKICLDRVGANGLFRLPMQIRPVGMQGRRFCQHRDRVALCREAGVLIAGGKGVYAWLGKAGVRHGCRVPGGVAPPVFQLEMVGEGLAERDLRRGNADGPHRLARHDTQGGGVGQLLELVRGDRIDERLELERLLTKGLHLPARRALRRVPKDDHDLLPAIQETAHNLEKERVPPGTRMALGIPAGHDATIARGLNVAVIRGSRVGKLWVAKIARVAKDDLEIA
jgi:hypothetical protein